MAVAIRQTGSYHTPSTGNYTYTGTEFPSGVQAGDLIMWCGLLSTTGTFADNSGGSYTAIYTGVSYRKIALGGETSLTVTTTGTQNGCVIAFSGVDTAAPIATWFSGASTTTSMSVLGLTAVSRTGTLVLFQAIGQSTSTGGNPFIGYALGSPYTASPSAMVGGVSGAWRKGSISWQGSTHSSGQTPTTPTETISSAPTTTSRTGVAYYIQPPDPYIPPKGMLMGVGR